MENILEVSNADQTQTENVSMPVEQPSIFSGEVPVDNAGVSDTIAQETPKETTPDETTRFEYWQSQADKAKGELSTIRNELDYYKNSLAPVEQMIRSNPEVLNKLEQSPSNGQPQGYPNGFQETSLKEPSAPEQPLSYNEVDALNDPQSESFKHRLAKEKYRDDYLGFLQKKDQVRETEMQQAYQQQMQQQNAQIGRIGVTMDNLAKLFELRTNTNPVIQQRTQEMQNQAERLAIPKTAAVQSGKPEQARSEQQLFNDAFFGK